MPSVLVFIEEEKVVNVLALDKVRSFDSGEIVSESGRTCIEFYHTDGRSTSIRTEKNTQIHPFMARLTEAFKKGESFAWVAKDGVDVIDYQVDFLLMRVGA